MLRVVWADAHAIKNDAGEPQTNEELKQSKAMNDAYTPMHVAVGYVTGDGKHAPVIRGTMRTDDGYDNSGGSDGGTTSSLADPVSQQLVWSKGSSEHGPHQSLGADLYTDTDAEINAASKRLCEAARCRYLPLDAERFERRLRLWRQSEQDAREERRVKEEARIKRARAHGERTRETVGRDKDKAESGSSESNVVDSLAELLR